ncbi:MAG: hypothetical protein ACRD6I_13920, partial [Candidatus Acidiferrales bacterium]
VRRYAENEEKQEQLFEGILETAAGYLRVEDAGNAARLATLLADTLLSLPERPVRVTRILLDTLTLLEAAALDAGWEAAEQSAWLEGMMRWWMGPSGAPAPDLRLSDRLMDLILHCYRGKGAAQVERWLRALLHQPVQGNRLSSALWRERVLAFLLAFYEASGQSDAFLDLCWEEGQDALAARKLVEKGDVDAALQLAEQGLGSSNAHREVAAALFGAGEGEAAQKVADLGLRYDDRGRGALLAWLAAHALANGKDEQALTLARRAWEQGASLERYDLLRQAAQRAERWHEMRRDLHSALEHRGEHVLLIEILLDEEMWDSAAALLPLADARRDELTEVAALGMAAHQPDEAIHLLFDLAELRAEGKSRLAYTHAAQALLAARNLAEATGNEALFAAQLQLFLDANTRRPALRDEVGKVLR